MLRRSTFSQLPFLLFVCIVPVTLARLRADSDLLGDANATVPVKSVAKPDSFADIIDRALEKEFTENEQAEGLSPITSHIRDNELKLACNANYLGYLLFSA